MYIYIYISFFREYKKAKAAGRIFVILNLSLFTVEDDIYY